MHESYEKCMKIMVGKSEGRKKETIWET